MNFPIQELSQKERPPLLSEIPDAPEKLFYRGAPFPKDLFPVAIVGSRKMSPYGRDAVHTIVEGLRGYPIAVISGLALGVDAAAHEAALAARLYTCAVPGSGLDDSVLYPRNHFSLAQKILESGGTLLSEFDPELKAAPWTFPRRNRIMAGLTRATLVIEAEEKSGTLITARLATEYNRDVWAVPGSIYANNSIGTNRLLARGATPITSARDVLVELGIADEKWVEEKKYDDCSTDEKRILELLSEPMAKDDLMGKIEMDASTLNILLSTMEIKGLITESLGLLRKR